MDDLAKLSIPGQVGYSTAICTVKGKACYTKADRLTIAWRWAAYCAVDSQSKVLLGY